jgi:hypothetical protein
MSSRPQFDSPLRAVYSVTDTARACGLSRARFYELIKDGIMPHPVYEITTRRPLYPAELHDLCLRVRKTYVGIDGQYVLFYERRPNEPAPSQPTRATTRSCKSNAEMNEIIEHLRALGVVASDAKIAAAVALCYPNGIPHGDFETAIRSVFLHLRRQVGG